MIKLKCRHNFVRNNPIQAITLIITSIVLLTALFSGCNKMGEYPLGNLKESNPFTGSETLLYISTEGDSIIFLGDGRYSEDYKSYPNNRPQYWVNELDRCFFTEQNSEYRLKINMASHYNRGSDMDIFFEGLIEPEDGECTYWDRLYIPLIVHKDNLHNVFYDSLKVLDRYYYEVYYDTTLFFTANNSPDCSKRKKAVALYYSKFHGIVKIDFEDGTWWGLKEVIP